MLSILDLYVIMLIVSYYAWYCVVSDEEVLIQNYACSNNFENTIVKWCKMDLIAVQFSLCVKLCVLVWGKYPGGTSFVNTLFI
jgi:hypothetical protein